MPYEYTDVNEMFPISKKFRVIADGQELKVFSDDEYDYVNIITNDIVNVEVIVNDKVETVDLRPTRRKKKYFLTDNTIKFHMAYGEYYSLEINGDLSRPLLVFCDERILPQKYDGQNLIYFKPGSYNKVDIMKLESDTVVFIDEGAIMDGKIDTQGKNNLRIIGNGYLFAKNRLSGGPAHPINLEDCDNIEINGITIVGYHTWNIRLWKCNKVLIRNVKIMSYNEWSDGIDVNCCEDVVIRNIFVKNEDDCVVIKCSKHRPYNFVGGDVRRVLVEDCVFWSGPRGNAMEIGYELNNAVIEDVMFRNIDVIHRRTNDSKYNRCVISIHNSGNATVRNITYENIYAEETLENFIQVTHMHVPVWGLGGGVIDNIRLRNVTLAGGDVGPSAVRARPIGLPADREHACTTRNITFEDLNILGNNIDSVEKAKEFGFEIGDNVENIKFV